MTSLDGNSHFVLYAYSADGEQQFSAFFNVHDCPEYALYGDETKLQVEVNEICSQVSSL